VNGVRKDLPYVVLGSFSVLPDGYRIILRTNSGR
jgi:hypothetical protein